jgi:hypothetical protein
MELDPSSNPCTMGHLSSITKVENYYHNAFNCY